MREMPSFFACSTMPGNCVRRFLVRLLPLLRNIRPSNKQYVRQRQRKIRYSVKIFAERIRHLRKTLLSLTLKAFAEKVGTSQGYIHELETGKKDKPSADFLQRISDTFGVRREWLEAGEGDPMPGGVREEPGPYRFDYKTNEGCKAAFEWFLEHMPLSDLLQRLSEILNDESQTPPRRLEMARAIMPVIERRKAELEEQASVARRSTPKSSPANV
jgi:transcriptional regulator with XRE-family HTH domain